MTDLPTISDVERLHLEPGDILVVHVPSSTSYEQVGQIKAAIAWRVAPHDVLVLSEDVQVSVLTPEAHA